MVVNMASLPSMVAAVAGAILCLGEAAALGQRQSGVHAAVASTITQIFALILPGISYLARPVPWNNLYALGRFMRLGWRYHGLIRTFRNHAAASFSQCTSAFRIRQGSVFGGPYSIRAAWNALLYSEPDG